VPASGLRRVRRDSGCYLSNENLNNNSSNSSTCEKKDESKNECKLVPLPQTAAKDQSTGGSGASVEDKLRVIMDNEGITLSCEPYTDQVLY
jgi:hypothetical protein